MNTKLERSSGNIFEDLNVSDPVEAKAKAELARRITSIIQHRHLKQVEAATLLGIDQPKISKLARGQLKEFSLERLMSFALLLDRDVEIRLRKRPRSRKESKLTVATV